jgi:peptide/nickel transport system permease protein
MEGAPDIETERGARRSHDAAAPRGRVSLRSLVVAYVVTASFLVSMNFLIPRSMPGDPIAALEDPSAPTYVGDDATRASLAEYYGLDEPLAVQYGRYLAALARFDLGTSIRYRAPVAELIRERLPWTLLLVATAMGLATALGLPAGIHSAWRRSRPVDRGLLGLFLALRSFPPFFLGSLAMFVFAVELRWFPVAGATDPFVRGEDLGWRLLDVAHHLALPALVLGSQLAAVQYLVMRGSMVAELGADYLVLGLAKGLPDRRLKYRYAARNALLPAVTVIALQLGITVTGSIFVETVFSYPGLGRLLFDAIGFRDYPVLQGTFLVLSLSVLAANLLAEFLYARLDPRVRS